MSKSKKQRRLMTEYVEALSRQTGEPLDRRGLTASGRPQETVSSQGSLFAAGRPQVGRSIESSVGRTLHVKYARRMLRNPQAVLPALFESIQLPDLNDQPAHLCVLNAQQMQEALDMAVAEFGRIVPPESVRPSLRGVSARLSFGIEAGGRLIGAYLVSADSLVYLPPSDLPELAYRPALQGKALLVHPTVRSRGFGRILRSTLVEMGRALGADYVWGGAIDELGNLDHWLHRRVLVHSKFGTHTTLEPIAADLKEAFLPLASVSLRERWMIDLGLNQLGPSPSDGP